jgi:hypothetical protein
MRSLQFTASKSKVAGLYRNGCVFDLACVSFTCAGSYAHGSDPSMMRNMEVYVHCEPSDPHGRRGESTSNAVKNPKRCSDSNVTSRSSIRRILNSNSYALYKRPTQEASFPSLQSSGTWTYSSGISFLLFNSATCICNPARKQPNAVVITCMFGLILHNLSPTVFIQRCTLASDVVSNGDRIDHVQLA